MQEENKNTPDPIKPDLKHDNMEYAASTEGDDVLDSDNETEQAIEEEEITPEELELLLADDINEQTAALASAEKDSRADEDNFINEPESKEVFEEDYTGDDEEEKERRL